MKKNRLLRLLILTLFIFGAGYLIINSYWNSLISAPNSSDSQTKRFVIFKGDSPCSISERLQKDGLIKSAKAFCFLAQREKIADIETGDFQLSPSMTAREILKNLASAVINKWVTLLEGWRIEEIAEKLNKELGIKNQEFVKFAEEGYMFPDTYLFGPKDNVSKITQTLRDNLDKKYNLELQNKIKKQGLTPKEGLILASIVEREARSDEARKMVASILLKRLRIDMGLNADATIQYALGYQPEEKSWWKRNLTKADLKIESPFNTYLYAGLPPSPICNPSLSSLNAVANATDTPYLYYYHDLKGVSHYGKTLEEHNQNIANYP